MIKLGRLGICKMHDMRVGLTIVTHTNLATHPLHLTLLSTDWRGSTVCFACVLLDLLLCDC
jgi:hypothetical protein